MRLIILILFLFSTPILVLAQTGTPYHLTIMAVQETSEGYVGSPADLFLELKEGSGRVFLETYPSTKTDTQISTRFAKEIGCDYFDLDCDRYDYIYTIKAQSDIIGGPSASAAVAALTAIAVMDISYDQDVAITGTINSGGIIGPVGGVKEKIDAAAKAGVKTVLISKGSSLQKEGTIDNETNSTELFNLSTYARQNLSIDVQEVIDLGQIVSILTGKNYSHKQVALEKDQEYEKIMKKLQSQLCDRTEKMEQEMSEQGITLNKTIQEEIDHKKENARNASQQGNHYASASYCFTANIQLRTYFYTQPQIHARFLDNQQSILLKKMNTLQQKLTQQEIKTISDLQASLVVRERLHDVQQQIEKAKENISNQERAGIIAYAEERYSSAASWMEFFSMDGRKFILDEQTLRQSCDLKLAEAEERYNYVALYVGSRLIENLRNHIDDAHASLERNESQLCLIEASQAKAEANAILSSFGVVNEVLDEYIEAKSNAVERMITENSAEGIFPILGYSYYQYARSLQDDDKFTALLYLEYALEMSNLEMYFPEEVTTIDIIGNRLESIFSKHWVLITSGFLGGLVVGIGIVILGRNIVHKKRK